MKSMFKLLDVVALLDYVSDRRLQIGQVGTIVEELAPSIYEVEFADNQGATIATCAVEADKLLKLTHAYAS